MATTATEREWIQLAFERPVGELEAEVRAAHAAGRDAPRDRRYGLPNLPTRLTITVTMEEKIRVLAALDILLGQAGVSDCASDEGRRVAALVRLADRVLAGEIPIQPSANGQADSGSTGDDPSGPLSSALSNADPTDRRAGDSGDGPPTPAEAKGRARGSKLSPSQGIFYHQCQTCHESRLMSDDGPIRIEPERIAELAPVSKLIWVPQEDVLKDLAALPPGEKDAPFSAKLVERILARAGGRCENPGCRRRLRLHAHHKKPRSEGGRSVITNGVALCELCHALVHAGRLVIGGSVVRGHVWNPVPFAPGVSVRDSEKVRAIVNALVEATGREVGATDGALIDAVAPESAADHGPVGSHSVPLQAGQLDSSSAHTRPSLSAAGAAATPPRIALPRVPRPKEMAPEGLVSDLARVPRGLGYSQKEAQEAVLEAIASLYAEGFRYGARAERPMTEEDIVRRMLHRPDKRSDKRPDMVRSGSSARSAAKLAEAT